MKYGLFTILAAIGLVASNADADTTYTLSLKNGKIPSDVKVENANGALPAPNGYKRGWTDAGWTTGQFGNRGQVLLSPTFKTDDTASENILTLPMMKIEEGAFLRWDALSMLPDRPEAYTVEIRPEGGDSWTELESIPEEKGVWRTRMAYLGDYAGQNSEIRFVCRTAEGYMLALDKVSVGIPVGPEIICLEDNTDRFHGRRGKNGDIKVTLLNAGTDIYQVKCRIEGVEHTSSWIASPAWTTGEEFTLDFAQTVPTGATGEVKYTVYCNPVSADEEYVITEGTIYCSECRLTPFIDKGTGMWCNSCPTGILAVDKMKHTYGDGIVVTEAHCNDLFNSGYFSHLGFYSIPRFKVNRNPKMSGESISPTLVNLVSGLDDSMMISIDGIALSADNQTAEVTATVENLGFLDNSDGRYRIGYVVTADIHDADNKDYYQENGMSIVNYDQYYYLPSRIPAPLAYFHEVALTEAGAFDGIEGSLPDTMDADSRNSFTWEIERPELLDDFNRARVAAYILDTETGIILNTAAARVDAVSGDESVVVRPVRPTLPGIYRMDGTKVSMPKESLPAGLYIIDGKKTVVKK